MSNGRRELPAKGKQFWTGRVCIPLEAVVVLTGAIPADRAGVWNSSLCSDLTPQHSNPSPTDIGG